DDAGSLLCIHFVFGVYPRERLAHFSPKRSPKHLNAANLAEEYRAEASGKQAVDLFLSASPSPHTTSLHLSITPGCQ
ncbi:hypothetical protein KUCAC02_035448, partial [Chaenocephalus aceratus]